VLATPEFGKWTKTGGLGVMTDELSKGLADLGEEIYVITPWYDIKEKANPDVLLKDGIKFVQIITIWISGEKYDFGLHYGKVNGVHIYFFHHPLMFPSAFCGDEPGYVLRQLVLFARVVLEILCQIKVIPSLMISNDWFTGLIPAYIKIGRFGDFFKETKVFHIIHNLDPSYEGRLFPKPHEGIMNWIHELPSDWLVDPFWKKTVINPSRCALINCDNWGTVSHSYKYELLKESPLSSILSQKEHPFSYPNGIDKIARFNLVMKETQNDHLKSKEIIQKKYFKMERLDDSIAIFGFVGRITEQKGVNLILEACD